VMEYSKIERPFTNKRSETARRLAEIKNTNGRGERPKAEVAGKAERAEIRGRGGNVLTWP